MAAGERKTSPSVTISRSVLGISMPMADLPGIGVRNVTSFDATAYSILRDSAVTRSTLTPCASSTSYRVTEGPRVKPVTVASTPNWVSTSVIAAMALSLTGDEPFGGAPLTRIVSLGSE
ncbi:unannotated protein [freshwater metagenome]|uniref:Unannotated protein n=1 Tax=freshwater metagenome TaxID=449393 RepID=A0A6J6J4H7_9ZZZZ